MGARVSIARKKFTVNSVETTTTQHVVMPPSSVVPTIGIEQKVVSDLARKQQVFDAPKSSNPGDYLEQFVDMRLWPMEKALPCVERVIHEVRMINRPDDRRCLIALFFLHCYTGDKVGSA
jgi:hypothetical protein